MRNRTPWGLGLTVALGLVVTLIAACGAAGHRPPPSAGTGDQDIVSAVQQAGPVDFWAVVQPFSGSLERSEEFLAEFMRHFQAQGLDRALEGFEATAVIILPAPPEGDRAHGSIGLTVPVRLEVASPLRVERVNFSQAATYTHRGPYEELGRIHERIEEAAEARRSLAVEWPVVLRLLNDPRLAEVPVTGLVVPLDEAPDRSVLDGGEQAAIARSVRAASPVSLQLVSQRFEGSPQQIDDFLREFMEHFTEQGLGDLLESHDVAPLAILLADPDRYESIPIEIGLPVQRTAAVKEPLTVSEFEHRRAVSYLHRGAYDELDDVHQEIEAGAQRMLDASPTFPVALRLISDPRQVPEAEIRTEIIVPLKG